MDILKSLFGSAAQLSAQEAHERIQSDTHLFLLDVRQPDEYKAGHIPGAKLVPLGQLAAHLDELPRDRDILCICESGSRSSVATRQLLNAGFRAINLRGGMSGWRYARLPVKTGKSSR